jgi:hypothetical protein
VGAAAAAADVADVADQAGGAGRADAVQLLPPLLRGRHRTSTAVTRKASVTCMLFAFRLSSSGKAVHKICASGGSEAFLEGHVHAFTTLGGVPTGKIRYDNLRAAVAQVLGFARQRAETPRWTAFRSRLNPSTLSTASPACRALTRKAVSRGRSAGSAATTSSQ